MDTGHISATIEDLVSRAAFALHIGSAPKAWVREVVSDLILCGLVVPGNGIIRNRKAAFSSGRRIASLCILTANRAFRIQRTLLSYAQNLDLHDRTADILVFDDSKSDERSEYLQALRTLEVGQPVRYGGAVEKEEYIQCLSREGIDPEISRFALLGVFPGVRCTPGANRNCILLDTIGDRTLTVDDDTSCKLTVHPARVESLRFGASEDPRDGWFYENRSQLMAETSWCSQDFLGEHEFLLGNKLSDLAAKEPSTAILHGPARQLILGIQQGRARVVATMSGIAGDSGVYASCSLLRSTGPKQSRLCASEAAFRRALSSRESFAVVSQPTISQHPFCIATTLGLDNTELLPPFLPVGRNEDGIFGALTRLATPHFIGHIPVAVLHDADPNKAYERFPQFRISDMVLCMLALVSQVFCGETRNILHSMGRGLQDIARLGDTDFENVLFKAATHRKSKQLQVTASVMNSIPECPTFWKAEVFEFHRHTLARLADPNCYVPIELYEARDGVQAKSAATELIAMTGRLLCAWPDIVDAAKHLRSREIQISKELGHIR